MIEIKMIEGEFEMNAKAGKVEFFTETVMVIWKMTEAYAEQRELSLDAAFEEIREKVQQCIELEKKYE